jgi:subtilase family serine protease
MYPLIESCEQKLDRSIINELNRLYSQKNLPDLYFENLDATKKGRYLDFNLTMKNSGTIDSESFILTILDDNKIIEERNFDGIKYGEGINFYATNLKLNNLNSKEIKFIIDKKNKINELDESNNEVQIKI